MKRTPRTKPPFKVLNKHLKVGKVTFDELKVVFQKLQIDSRQKLNIAKKERLIILPNPYALDAICIKKTNKPFEDFIGFKPYVKRIRRIEIMMENDYITKFKKWCSENQIRTLGEYRNFKNKPKEYPHKTTIIKYYGEDYFTKTLGLSRYKKNLNSKLLNEEFLITIKNWCLENNIDSITKYNSTKKPEGFPSSNKIRTLYGRDFLYMLLRINLKTYNYLKLEEAREICLQNGIYKTTQFVKFYNKYNSQNEIKLPSNVYYFYKIKWFEFITPV